MSAAKKGQKLKEVTKDYMLRVRMDEHTLTRLDYICEKTGKSRSEVVRDSIEKSFSQKIE